MKALRESRVKGRGQLFKELERILTERGARVRVERQAERRRSGERRMKGVTETISFLAASRRTKSTRRTFGKRG